MNGLLPLQRGIIYGPVNSRRLGKSLGINLMPWTCKLCSFNCVYCHYGRTTRLTSNLENMLDDLPSLEAVVQAVERAVKSETIFDYITFSGNGESTLHPDFPDIVDEVIRLRDKHRPGVKVALLSNSTGLLFEKVRKALKKIDLPVLKLDAGIELGFKAINRPAKGIDFKQLVGGLTQISDFLVQTILMDGSPSNADKEDLLKYFDLIATIKPLMVHIYSIDRAVPNRRISLVAPERLEEIAAMGAESTGILFKHY